MTGLRGYRFFSGVHIDRNDFEQFHSAVATVTRRGRKNSRLAQFEHRNWSVVVPQTELAKSTCARERSLQDPKSIHVRAWQRARSGRLWSVRVASVGSHHRLQEYARRLQVRHRVDSLNKTNVRLDKEVISIVEQLWVCTLKSATPCRAAKCCLNGTKPRARPRHPY